ncbi:MAG: elongation factor P maturation arginine rhamnosyltransferase EarP [Pseudomonadota bacterium]|uniref:elongation factor P maturation arginine rhamnosyltransferase EarP n=1 Tax=Polaromonas sp. TaxID=1869339 RepID=UPI0017ACE67E|nr:elongation factor P maturation arginine rhamnosyltransferase EarP [Polaromonas sp.]MBA3592940.1 elongation factor P maturation arginine rhamnosyltransferase EarP [Polaromonas sp.]MDQ3272119.1 elongation factor P maturation arginine rhamnosyltransferase EarP [Pseudomonadota bacterium]
MNRSRQWDIFCKVIDNHGDIGVCWRLSADLAARGQQVRLWVDDASALEWMAPDRHAGVTVLPWLEPLGLNLLRLDSAPCEVLVEAFGCEVAPEFIAACADQQRAGAQIPVWINLEYLSAEPYVERCHGLPSPVQHGAAAGWTKWFFYPGLTAATGGLLREQDLVQRQAAFGRKAWLQAQDIDGSGVKLVSLFCYEPPALTRLLHQFAREGLAGEPVRLLVAAGRGAAAIKAVLMNENGLQPLMDKRKLLSISYLPLLAQTDFDHLLWACDLNFVRGEDSVVRALWAGKPFVWQIYPQDDQAHQAKLQAFLDSLNAPPSLRAFHLAWNGQRPDLPAMDSQAWSECVRTARQELLGQPDLGSQLLGFVAKKS